MAEPSPNKLVGTFLKRLTNLSGRSRSIFLPRLVQPLVDVQQLSFLKGHTAFTIIENLIAGQKTTLVSELDSRLEANNEASKKLKQLHRLDQFLFEEQGTKDLHVGWPFVHGKFLDETLVRCPLIYFPVSLELVKGNWLLVPRTDAEITFNKSFLLAYAHYNRVQPAEEALNETFEDAGSDSTSFRNFIYESFKNNRLEINFNQELFRNELIAFKSFSKDEFTIATQVGQLKLQPESVLGIFPQAGSSLVPDYLSLIDKDELTDLEDFFTQRSASADLSSNFLKDVKEEHVYSIYPLDVWQENALKGVKRGHSLVIQGPPGTGKSQLISNLISDAIAHKKRVLLVCQKRVALDVVYNRLKEKKLHDFIGLVHDFRDDRKELFAQLARQIERVDEYKTRNNSLDTIQLERKFYDTSRRIDQLVEELENFKTHLFDESYCGISIKQLYLQSNRNQPAIELKQELPYFKWHQVDAFRRKLKAYARLAERFEQPEFSWHKRKSFSSYSIKNLSQLEHAISEIYPWFKKLTVEINACIHSAIDWDDCLAYSEKSDVLPELIELLEDPTVFAVFQQMIKLSDGDTNSLWLANMEKVITECFQEEGPELTVPATNLGQFQLALYRSMKARKNLFGLVRWELFSTDKFLIKRTLVANNLQNNKAGFQELESKLDRRLNLEHNLSKLKTAAWLTEVPGFQNTQQIREWFEIQFNAVRAKTLFGGFRELKTIFSPANYSQQDFIGTLNKLFRVLGQLPAQQLSWSQWLLPAQIKALTEKETYADTLIESLRTHFDSLCEYDRLKEHLQEYESQTIKKLFEITNSWKVAELDALFCNSICLAWIDHIEQKHPELRMVTNGQMEIREEELRALMEEKESMSVDVILMRAREHVVDDMRFNRLNNRVTYRDLLHQLTKKKKIWPIRKIITEFEEDVFRLMPCWMASPESVSSVLPMNQVFDLVIFDEASQCFAEKGIPAMYRGKQVVIAGDSQQLQPADLYTTRWNEESDDPDLEVTSLLELGERYLFGVSLNGHYRSKLPALIQFSNHHFYKGRLQLLPDHSSINQQEAAIIYNRVHGTWENNCNLHEAIEVVRIIQQLSQNGGGKEIGVITFNAPQQYLILDILEQSEREDDWQRPPTLFVKNIENVQGDEKDIILFSIGYAPDKKGKLHAQFGSLSVAGGENRLNVAVTRAREKVIVVASIDPDDLHVDDSKNNGPRLLREYLRYAQHVSTKKEAPPIQENLPHAAEWYLKSALRDGIQKRFEVTEKFPFADFTLLKDGQYYALLLTDDDLYHSNLSAKSAHGLLPRLLEAKKWKHKMFYSRNWWLEKDRFWNEVGKFNS